LEVSDCHPSRFRNHILRTLPEGELRALCGHLEHVSLKCRNILHFPLRNIERATFVESGIVSLIVDTMGGRSVEAGLVGSDGMTGFLLAGGIRRANYRAVVQVQGTAFQMRAEQFEKAMGSLPILQKRILAHSCAQAMQFAQNAACNRVHNATQRLSKWLMMVYDRSGSDLVCLSHDFLATLLGTDRPTVTIAVNALQTRGAIEYRRRNITILSRQHLESVTCACYSTLRESRSLAG
jgi:CRP-like cAMP-binding protein